MNAEKRKEELFIWAHNLKDKKISENLTFGDLFQYEDINLWPFVTVGICQAILEKEKNRELSKKNFILRNKVFPRLEFFLDLFLYLTLKFTLKNPPNISKNPIILTTIDRYWKPVYNPQTGTKSKNDEFYEAITKKLKSENHHFIFTGETNLFRDYSLKPLKIAIDKSKEGFPYMPLELFWSLKAHIKAKRAKKHFKKSWITLKSSKNLKQILTYKNEDFSSYLMPFFEYYFNTVLGRKIKLLEMSNNLLEKTKPLAIIMQNESAGWEKTLIYTARKRNVKTIALQHGVVYKLHEGYFHTKNKSPDPTLPDITTVYGPETESVLIDECHFPKNTVTAIGQPRYDKISEYQTPQVKERFFKRYKIPEDKKIFLLTTQPIVEKDRRAIFTGAINLAKEFPNVQLVIKAHPSELDLSFYEQTIKNELPSAILLDGKQDTFEAISVCDLFGVLSSTTALEAMMFKKPVFILNFTNYANTLPWLKEKAAIEIKNHTDGKQKLQRALNNPKSLNPLLKNEEKFLKRYYYKLDGQATERFYNLLKPLLK